jgi:hypothetical protein|tara:strand:- start:641 stop:991 length:351 start_codon:yes stop_codon:yes gene_type:complete
MATLTAKLTLSSSNATSDQLNLSVSDTLSITKDVIAPSKIALSTGDLTLFATSYTKSYLYFKNLDSAINITVSFGSQVSLELGASEFTFLPWSGAGAVVVAAASGTPYLEYAIFEA